MLKHSIRFVLAGVTAYFSCASSFAAEPIPWCEKWQPRRLDAKTWDVAYDGHGRVDFGKGIRLTPKSAVEKAQTHAALALLKDSPTGERYAVRVRYKNLKTLRSPASQPWETFWLMFDYRPDAKGKRTNYVIHKPNGMELGRAYNDVDQDFVETTSTPKAKTGTSYEMTLVREPASIRAYVDGQLVLESTKTTALERADGGRLGLYTEDSDVLVESVDVCESPSTQ